MQIFTRGDRALSQLFGSEEFLRSTHREDLGVCPRQRGRPTAIESTILDAIHEAAMLGAVRPARLNAHALRSEIHNA